MTSPSAATREQDRPRSRGCASRHCVAPHRPAQDHGRPAYASDRSYATPKQIDDGEYPDPDDVERVPEQRKEHNPAQDIGTKTLCEDLGHHGEEPQYAGGDVEAMAADEGEERGQESAARWAIAAGNEISEFAKLNDQKDEAEQTRHGHPEIEPEPVAHIGRDARHAARETRQ